MSLIEMFNQRANFNRIDEAINNGISYDTVASALRDKGLVIDPRMLQHYHQVSVAFQEQRFLSVKDVKILNDPLGTEGIFSV